VAADGHGGVTYRVPFRVVRLGRPEKRVLSERQHANIPKALESHNAKQILETYGAGV